ncbi:MAG: response regulator transcription factor [Firmicutes bacterium]|nr:response regulator transcription factor [Bacillota bacterium]
MIFAVEDDTALQEIYQYSLEDEFNCRCFNDGNAFFAELAKRSFPDLILLDIMLPGDDGFIILARLKADQTTAHIPVIMVSAKGEEVAKVKGLNMGADDYIAKPFGVLELIARIKANLRKSIQVTAGSIIYKNIIVDHIKHRITVNGIYIQTTLKEYNLLALLCENPEQVQDREKIFNDVWDSSFAGETRTLDIHIKELRKKLSAAGSEAIIQTIRGVGYMLT